MPPTLKSLGIDRLSALDRINLAYAIWESVELNTECLPLSEEELAEAERRLARHHADPSRAMRWEDLKAELLGPNADEACTEVP